MSNVSILDPSIITQGVRESKIDLATPVNIYTSLRADARAERADRRAALESQKAIKLSDLALDEKEKAQKRQFELQGIFQNSLNQNGTVNAEKALSLLNRKGFIDEAFQLEDRMAKAYKAKQEREQEMGNAFLTVAEAKNPVEAFLLAREEGKKKGWQMSQGVLNYMPTEKEMSTGQIDPRVMQEMKYHGERVLTPEQKLARAKAMQQGDSPEELKLKQDKLAFEFEKLGLEKNKYKLENDRFVFDEKKFKDEADRITKGLLPKEKAIQVEEGLRKEFIGQNKDFQSVGDSFNRIKASIINPSAAGDLSLIFNYMKMLDPGSTVREGEFATAQNAGGVDERVRASWNKLLKGERLSTEQRNDFSNRASMLMDAAISGYDKSINSYRKLSENYGVNPDNVTIDISRQSGKGKAQSQTSEESDLRARMRGKK